MQPVSALFTEALTKAYEVSTLVEVLHAGAVVAEVEITDGAVTPDEGSSVRRSGWLDLTDTDLTPRDVDDLLAPFGPEVRISTGINVGGYVERVTVFTGGITLPETGSLYGPLRLTADDRSRTVARSRLLKPWNTPAGTLATAEIKRLIADVNPAWEVYDFTGSRAVTVAATWDEDRWAAVDSLATDIGAEVFFDALGRCIIRPIPDGTASPVWALDVDHDAATLADASLSMTSERAYNLVVARSSASGIPPVAGFAYVSAGALAWPGWQNPRYYASPQIRTVEQAMSAAASILPRSLAVARDITAIGAVHPGLEVGDVVTISLPDGTSEPRILTRFTIPLTEAGESSTYQTRASVTSSRTWSITAGSL